MTRDHERLKENVRADSKMQYECDLFVGLWKVAWVILLILGLRWAVCELGK